MKISVFKWYKDVSIAKKLYFTVGIMALLIAIELFVLIFPSIHCLQFVPTSMERDYGPKHRKTVSISC